MAALSELERLAVDYTRKRDDENVPFVDFLAAYTAFHHEARRTLKTADAQRATPAAKPDDGAAAKVLRRLVQLHNDEAGNNNAWKTAWGAAQDALDGLTR